MRYFPRASWTPTTPTPYREYHKDLPFFLEQPEVEFCTPDDEVANYLYLYTSPVDALQRLLNAISHLADINYNYALPANELGCFTIRGLSNKCLGSENLRVLLLLGKDEDASDVLKVNQQDFISSPPELIPPGEILDYTTGVHLFDLTEYLTWLGYYFGPNNGTYNDTLVTSIEVFQHLNRLPVTGVWDELTSRSVLREGFQPRARNGNLDHKRPPVGTNKASVGAKV